MLPVPLPGKAITNNIETGGRWFFGIVQRLLRLSETQTRHASLIEAQAGQIEVQAAELAELRQAVRDLQTREEVLLARAEVFAARAAIATTTDISRRLGFLESRADKR